jgi:hypothetical protein
MFASFTMRATDVLVRALNNMSSLFVEYLTRAGQEVPENGVPFSALLTISDPDGEKPVFTDMRQSLSALGVQVEDIRTAARILTRV